MVLSSNTGAMKTCLLMSTSQGSSSSIMDSTGENSFFFFFLFYINFSDWKMAGREYIVLCLQIERSGLWGLQMEKSIVWTRCPATSPALMVLVSVKAIHPSCPAQCRVNALLLFSSLVMSNSLQSHERQHTRLPCPSLSPGVCSNSCPLSWWCHPVISSSVTPCPQSFPASGSFPVDWFFTSGGQSIGASNSASVLSMNIQGSFPVGLTGLIFLLSKGLSRVFSSTTVWKHQFFSTLWLLQNPILPKSTQKMPSFSASCRGRVHWAEVWCSEPHPLWQLVHGDHGVFVHGHLPGLYKGQVYPALTCTSESVIIVSCGFSWRWRARCAASFWTALGNRVTLSRSSFVDEETVGSSSCPI